MDAFQSRLSSDPRFAEAVEQDPAASAAAAGLDAEESALVVGAVARAQQSAENLKLVQAARAEVDLNGAGAFLSASVEDLVRLGRVAGAMARLCADRSDEELRLWGDVQEWGDRIAWLRQINAEWPTVAAARLGSRSLPDDPDARSIVTLAVEALNELAVIANA